MQKDWIDVEAKGANLRLSVMRRDGAGTPIVFLHGFGSTKEDYGDAAFRLALADHTIIAPDFPGFGESVCGDAALCGVELCLEACEAVLDHYGIGSFHLVGHSMGGLTAVLLAHRHGSRMLSLTSIEGNLAPEDCFLSRQAVDVEETDSADFFKLFVERTWHTASAASAIYALGLQDKVQSLVAVPVFRSIVAHSDGTPLLEMFTDLACPRLFMYGDENRGLTYLPLLRAAGVRLVEVPECGHFPMYSNPPVMWGAIEDFILGAEAEKWI